jgi:transposase
VGDARVTYLALCSPPASAPLSKKGMLSAQGREFLAGLELPDAARQRIGVALAMIEALDRQLAPIEQQLRRLSRRQTGCRALMRHYGIGELTAPTILCELGDVTRLSASRKACAAPVSTSACTAQTAARAPAS